MKKIFIFDDESPDDEQTFHVMIKAKSMLRSLQEFAEYLHKTLKYNNLSEEELDQIDELQSKFYEILEDNKLQLNDYD